MLNNLLKQKMFFLVIHAGYESSDHRIAHSPGLCMFFSAMSLT